VGGVAGIGSRLGRQLLSSDQQWREALHRRLHVRSEARPHVSLDGQLALVIQFVESPDDRSEIDRVMALCGWDRLDQIDRSVLFDPAARSESILGAFSRKLTSMLK